VEEDSSNNLWHLVRSKRCDTMGVAPLKRGGIAYSDGEVKAGILNDQFCDAFTREDLFDLPAPAISPHPNIPDISVSTIGVRTFLSGLNSRKAAGPDEIPCRLLRETAAAQAPALTALFNRLLSTGVVLAIWKHALVQPVFKREDCGQAANDRTISSTCVCCKLLDLRAYHQIGDHRTPRPQQHSQRRATWLPEEEFL
jgi:hypothetical protein